MTSLIPLIYRGLIYASLARSSEKLYHQMSRTKPMPREMMVVYFIVSLGIFEPLREIDRHHHPHPSFHHQKYTQRLWWLRMIRYFMMIMFLQTGLYTMAKSISSPYLRRLVPDGFSAVSLILWTAWVSLIGESVYHLLTPMKLSKLDPAIQSQIQHL
jgi:hypothetical protein